MERPKLSEQAEQRIFYFNQGCDRDGFEIKNIPHLQLAYEFISEAVHRDLGTEAGKYLEENVQPKFKEIARALINRAEA